MITIEECEERVTDALMAWRLCCPEGSEFTGAALYRWLAMPAKERAYFRALTARYEDPDSLTRTREATVSGDGSRVDYTYTPPLPEPCACGRPVFVIGYDCACRCTRCLKAWGLQPQLIRGEHVSSPPGSPIDWVDRKDMGHALARLP